MSARRHPAQFTPAIIGALSPLIDAHAPPGTTVCDPFAGAGLRLGALCDELGYTFVGLDLERWPDADPRVRRGDATNPRDYSVGRPLIVTSPTYGNGLNDHHQPREDSRRYTYRVALGEPLAENNSGRYGIRGGRRAWHTYWRINRDAVHIWAAAGLTAIVNVKAFIHAGRVVDLPGMWEVLLIASGYRVASRVTVGTPGIRHGSNAEARIDHEVILLAEFADREVIR